MLGGNGISDEYHIIRHVMNLEAVNTYEGKSTSTSSSKVQTEKGCNTRVYHQRPAARSQTLLLTILQLKPDSNSFFF